MVWYGMLMYWHAFTSINASGTDPPSFFLFQAAGSFFSCLAPLLPSWLGPSLRALVGVGQGSPQPQGPETALSGANSIPRREPTGRRRVA